MRRAAVPIVAALLLTGLAACGAASPRTSKPHFSSLCIDAGLPLVGSDAAAARGVLIGLRMRIPSAGLSLGGYRIRLCKVFDDGGSGAGPVLANTRQATENVHTIAYVGELAGGQARVADALLAQAGIALISPSGPVPAPAPASTPIPASGAARTPARPTALYLLPSSGTQADAAAQVSSLHRCGSRRHGRPVCTVSSAAALCTGIAPAARRGPLRFCVLAGPDLASGWASPAVAYGDSAGQLLVSSLRAIVAGGKDIADRATVLHALSHAQLKGSPIGPIRFDSEGGIEADQFTAYTVKANGGLIPTQAFRTPRPRAIDG